MNERRHYEVNCIITLDAFAVTRFNMFKMRYFTYRPVLLPGIVVEIKELEIFNIILYLTLIYPYNAKTTIKQQNTFFILILQYGSIRYNMVLFIVY